MTEDHSKIPGDNLWKKLLAKLGVDQAVRWTLLTQMIRMFTGPVTMILMLRYLTPELQGYIYAFGGVLAVSIFLELGFSQNILQFASHEFSKLQLNSSRQLTGDPVARSRLTSLARLSFKYYSIAAVLFLIVTTAGGGWFFRTGHDVGVSWHMPWLLACVASALSLAINPCWSLLEGCNQIPDVERFRFWNSMTSFALSVIGYISGLALYVGPLVALVSFTISLIYLLWRWREFFKGFLSKPTMGVISWSKEIWPFQWRIGVSWMSGYLLFSAVVPIVFRLAGPVEAGKYGFTMALVNTVATISSSWAITKLPRYGMLVAQEDWIGLRALWRRSTASSLIAAVLGSIGMLFAIAILTPWFPQLGARYSGPLVATILCACMVVQNFINSCAYSLRAFKQEPYMWLSVIGALLNFALITLFTHRWGALGAATGFATCSAIMFFPSFSVFKRKQKQFLQGHSLL